MLEALKFPEINHPGYFVGGEHPIHQCLEEFSSDVSSDLPPDILSAKFFDPLGVILRENMRVFLRFLPEMGSILTKMASTSGPRQAGISEQDCASCKLKLMVVQEMETCSPSSFGLRHLGSKSIAYGTR